LCPRDIAGFPEALNERNRLGRTTGFNKLLRLM
jgi:hypothetical protein